MKLGAFSISLTVKNLEVSRKFYETLGFSVFAGDKKHNYYILKNDNALIGIFQGRFDKNILTFNPGWDENANKFNEFDDIRTIQKHLKHKGFAFSSEADESTTGPASFVITDPDGNTILVDQHV
ncbi:MAG: VOC family protein [Flavobacteriaceae bacterium]|nr:MAG: VOC family protein [Flavobacteriaceae bacterium]